MGAGKRLQNAPYGIDIGAGIHPRCAVFLFGSGVFVCMAGRVGVAVGIAVAQVYELHVVADMGDENIAGLQVEVHNLVAVQITDHTEQLLQKTVGLLALHAKKAARLPLVLLIFLASFTFVWGWLNGAWFGLPKDVLPGWMQGWSMITDPANSAAAHKFVKFYGIEDSDLTATFWEGFPSKLTQWFCFLLAMLHLMSAHIVRFFTGIRKDWRELSNIGWALMIFANFLLAVGLIVFSGTFPSWGVYVYIAAAVLIVVTIRPAAALNLPFDMIGSFTDVLSYIRLFAVGLSGMYIAQKFNMMGLMVKDAFASQAANAAPAWHDAYIIAGFVLLILVAVAGHILNLALGFLGVLVHAVRLNTLEFSNHMGLQWAGFKFKPFSAKQNND